MDYVLTKCVRVVTGDHETVISKKTIDLLGNFNDTALMLNVCALILILKSADYRKLARDDTFHDTRIACNFKLHTNKFKLKCTDHSFASTAPKYWNNLEFIITFLNIFFFIL